jgi:hypothetical protein
MHSLDGKFSINKQFTFCINMVSEEVGEKGFAMLNTTTLQMQLG